MSTLLIQAWLGRAQHPVVPLGLLTLAASQGGEETRILDLNLHSRPLDELRKTLRAMRPRRVGISLRNADTTNPFDPFSYIPAFVKQVRVISETLPRAEIFAGGGGFSLFHREIMEALPMLTGGTVGHGEPEMPPPRWDLIELEPYLPYQRNLSVGVEAMRGCDLSCSYCPYPLLSGRNIKNKARDDLAREASVLKSRGAEHLFICAPVFNRHPDLAREAARALGGTGVTWEAYHTPSGFTSEYACLLRKCGCTTVSFSPDGGREEDLEALGKGFGPDEVEKAVAAAAGAGLMVCLSIFPYLPGSGPMAMTKAFFAGRRWAGLAGVRLARLRYTGIRRLPGGSFGPGSPAFRDRVPRSEFVLPRPPWMALFRWLKRLLEKNLP